MLLNKENLESLAHEACTTVFNTGVATLQQLVDALVAFVSKALPNESVTGEVNQVSRVIELNVSGNWSISLLPKNMDGGKLTMEIHVSEIENLGVSVELATISKAMKDDPGFAWGWVSNLAMTMVDSIGISRRDAIKAAGAQMQHAFGVDVTEDPDYLKAVFDDNTVHVTITGFQEKSGAEIMARDIHDYLVETGYTAELNFADTSLTDDEKRLRGERVLPNTKVVVTGVESRYHTDTYTDDPESGLCLASDDDDAFNNTDALHTEPGGCFCSGTPPRIIRLTLDDNDPTPDQTIAKLQHIYRDAQLEITGTLPWDYSSPEVAVDTVIEEPEPIAETTATMTERVHNLADPESRINAYALSMEHNGKMEVAVMHVDTESDAFDAGAIHATGVKIIEPDELEEILKEHVPEALAYLEALKINNATWLAKYGDVPAKPREDRPFTIYTIDQSEIPTSLYDVVESSWADWQKTTMLPQLAEELGDPTVVIDFTEYRQRVVGGGMVVREHPRLEELFLKLLKKRAETNDKLSMWLKAMGK